MTSTPRQRWLPRYTLRTLFVGVTVISCALGWVMYQLHWIRERQALLSSGDVSTQPTFPGTFSEPETPAPWTLRLFGEEGVHSIYIYRSVGDARSQEVQDRARILFPESRVVPPARGIEIVIPPHSKPSA